MRPRTDLQNAERSNLTPTETRTPTPWQFSPYPVAIPTALSRLPPRYVTFLIFSLCRHGLKGSFLANSSAI
jgi:hypothetical protein